MGYRLLATQRKVITTPYGNGHSGVDLGWQSTPNDAVLAHSQGVVTMAYHWNGVRTYGDNNSYGNFVKIRHSNGYSTLYAHLNDISVKVGDIVVKGQVIGHMGNTGNSYGEHLHFEVRTPAVNGADSVTNPTSYIEGDLPGLPTPCYKTGNYKVTSDELNVRAGANTATKIIGQLKKGEVVHITETTGSWGKFVNGWICLDYTKTTTEVQDYDMTQEQFNGMMDKYLKGLAMKTTSGWAEEAIDYVKKEGIMNGDADGKMRPRSFITREEVAQIFFNASK